MYIYIYIYIYIYVYINIYIYIYIYTALHKNIPLTSCIYCTTQTHAPHTNICSHVNSRKTRRGVRDKALVLLRENTTLGKRRRRHWRQRRNIVVWFELVHFLVDHAVWVYVYIRVCECVWECGARVSVCVWVYAYIFCACLRAYISAHLCVICAYTHTHTHTHTPHIHQATQLSTHPTVHAHTNTHTYQQGRAYWAYHTPCRGKVAHPQAPAPSHDKYMNIFVPLFTYI